MTIRQFAAILPLTIGLLSGVARADGDDHEEARRALESGRALPLAEILQKLRREIDGEVVDVELEREHDRYIYELKVMTTGGRLLEVDVDALTARILKLEKD